MCAAASNSEAYHIEIIEGRLTDVSKKETIRTLYGLCYPGEHNADDSLDEVFQQMTFLHEEDDCTWLLLWLPDARRQEHPRLVAMLISVEYHDSTYAFGYGVLPSLRRMGLGKRLMYELEKLTLSEGRCGRISSTVDARQPRLVKYYQKEGGSIQSRGITSSNAQPPPSVRVIKEFSQEEAQAGIDSAHAAILKGLSKLRWRHTMLNCFLILLPVTAAVALVCWPALREI